MQPHRPSLRQLVLAASLGTSGLLLVVAAFFAVRLYQQGLRLENFVAMHWQVLATFQTSQLPSSELTMSEVHRFMSSPVEVEGAWIEKARRAGAGVYRYHLWDAQGQMLDSQPPDSGHLPGDQLRDWEERLNAPHYRLTYQDSLGWSHLITPLNQNGKRVAYLDLSTNRIGRQGQLHNFGFSTAAWVAILLVTIAGVNLLLLTRILRPLEQLRQTSEKVSQGNLDQRVTLEGPREIVQVGHTLNQMLDHLQSLLVAQKAFLADASHELKTPLMSCQGQLYILRQCLTQEDRRDGLATVEQLERESRRMASLVQELLELLKAEEPVEDCQPLNLGSVVAEAAELTRPLYPGRELEESLEPQPAWVVGRRQDLVRAVENLLRNALNYSDSEVRLSLREASSGWIIEVEDRGIGIAPEHLSRLGQRFFRVDPSRSRDTGGSGLGLAITRAIVERHLGSLDFDSTLGLGTRVRLTLPKGPASDAVQTG